MTDSSKLFKNYYDIQGNLLSGELTQVEDPETKEMLVYVDGVRVHRIFDANVKATIRFFSKGMVVHEHIDTDIIINGDPKELFSCVVGEFIVIPQLTNFKLEFTPIENKLTVYKQSPDNSWMKAEFTPPFQKGDVDMPELFRIHFVENVGCVFKAQDAFINANIDCIVITVQTD